jgi:high-affinity nickel-transport protein
MGYTTDADDTRTTSRQYIGMGSVIVLLNVIGWTALAFSPHQTDTSVGPQAFGWGLGLTSFILGVRHAFDADHIAAIDNTTRKLILEGRRAGSVGFWFSLGHSTVVFFLPFLVAIGAKALVDAFGDNGSAVKESLGFIGTVIGGGFLVLIGGLNLQSLIGIAQVFRRMRSRELDEQELEELLAARGFIARLLHRVLAGVRKPAHMYIVGFAFGIGFDTATEVTLLVVAGGVAASSLPWYAVLVIPVLFAAGMSLFDTADGVAMTHAYRWAFVSPIRKVFYNLTITALSVVVALGIGGIELLQLAGKEARWSGALVDALNAIDLEQIGFGIVGLFLCTWAVSLAVWRFGQIEQRWT